MRAAQILASILLIVGGLNWGLVAIADFDLVAAIVGLSFGDTNAISRVIYGLVGVAAVVEAISLVTVRGTVAAEGASPNG